MNSVIKRGIKKAIAWSALSGLALCGFSALAEDTSFETIEKQLDRKGNFYLYFDGKESFQSAEEYLKKIETMLTRVAGKNTDSQNGAKDIKNFFSVVFSIYHASGLGASDGFGMSSIKVGEGLYRSRTVLHCPKGKTEGLLWNFAGKPPHNLDAIKLMPASTVVGGAGDLDLKGIWSKIKESIAKSGQLDIVAKIQEAEKNMKAEGFDLDKLFASYDGEIGGLLSLDKSKIVNLPIPNLKKPVAVPAPALAIFIKTKDDTLFDLLASKFPMMQPVEKAGVKMVSMEVPIPMPIKFQPTLTKKGQYLIFSSSRDLIDSIFATMDGAANISSTENFKRLSKGIELKGNGFMYADRMLTDIVSEVMGSVSNEDIDLSDFYDKESMKYECFKVTQQSEEGILSTINCNKSGLSILTTQMMVAPTAIMAGMLLPALNSAREKARRISCASNLKQIGLGLKQYSMDHDDKFPAKDGAAGLEELRKEDYITDPKIYVCPNMSTVPAKQDAPLAESNVDYIYLAGGWTEEIGEDMPLAIDKLGNHDRYVNILFTDGHVTGYPGTYNSISEVAQKLFSSLEAKDKKLLLEKAAALDKVYGYSKDAANPAVAAPITKPATVPVKKAESSPATAPVKKP